MVEQTVSAKDRALLRDLAKRVAEIAALPIQQERIRLWKALNALRPERPLVAIYPENAWNELVPPSTLQCERGLRGWEMMLRRTIYQHEHIPDDRPLHGDVLVRWEAWPGGIGLSPTTLRPTGDGPQAVKWNPPVKCMADTEKLHVSEVSINREVTERIATQARDLFGDTLNVRIWGGQPFWSVGISQLIYLRGLQEAMLDMYTQPELLHRILAVLRDNQMHFMDVIEKENILSLNNDVTRIEYFMGSGHEGWTDELPADDFTGRVRWKDMWGLGEMQEFSGVGPDQFYEFSLQYQLPMLHRFGLVDYGCCEPLDKMYDMLIREIPKLRRLSVTSPYASKQVAAEKLGNRFVFSWKPNPTPIATAAVDWDWVEKDIRETLDVGRGCCLEMIMKSTETIGNDPERVTRWVELARRLAEESIY